MSTGTATRVQLSHPRLRRNWDRQAAQRHDPGPGEGPDGAFPEADLARLSGGVLRPARILQTFVVKANKRENAEVLQVRVPAIANRPRMVVAIDKPEPG